MPSYTEKKQCPYCDKEITLEVTPRFDEPDDIESEVYKEDEDEI